MEEDLDSDQWSDLTEEEDTSEQLQNHLNPSSSAKAPLFKRFWETVGSYILRKRNTASRWTPLTYVDGYSWIKHWEQAIPGSIYPREYFWCSQGCLVTKHVQRSDDVDGIFKVTYRGRHTCDQSSHLASAAAVEPTEAASDDKDVFGKLEGVLRPSFFRVDDGYSWTKYGQPDILRFEYPSEDYRCAHRISQGCQATKQVQGSEVDPTTFAITYQGRHTCAQSSHLPEKSKMIAFERILVVANFILELPSAVFDQLSSVTKPLYALILMLLSFAALGL